MPIAWSHQDEPPYGSGSGTGILLTIWCLLLVLWLGFSTLVVPPLMKSAYRGESLPALNAIIEGRNEVPVEYYLDKWNHVVVSITMAGLAGLLVAGIASSRAFFRKLVGEATPGTLGAIRLLTCTVLLITTSWEDLGSVALLPAEMRLGKGTIGLLFSLPIGLEGLVADAAAMRILQYATELLLFLGMIGWLTRIVIPLAAVGHFLALGVLIDYSFYWHQNLVPLYLLIALSFTPCGDGLSVDRLWKLYRGRAVPNEPAAVYGWSRYLCWTVIVLPYVQSGWSKLRMAGWSWWNATNMRGMLYGDALTPREFDWHWSLSLTSAPDVVFTALGMTTVILEVSYILVLFSGKARRILPALMIAAHVGILLLQRILFFDLIVLQLAFLDFAGIRRAITRRIASHHRQIEVLFDGSCALCRRTMRLLGALDLFGAIEFRDFRQLNLAEYNPRHGLDLTVPDLDESMHVVARGRVFRGFSAYRVIGAVVPLLWPLVPFLFLPGTSSIGHVIYGRIAPHRARVAACDVGCAIEPSIKDGRRSAGGARVAWRHRLGYALTMSFLVAAAVAIWLQMFEFYPLSAWHLFAMLDMSGKIKYYKVLGHYDSGEISIVRLEDGIGAIALDSRYSVAIDKCFGGLADVPVCEKFLIANGSAYNVRRRPGNRLTHYEIQAWMWDFLSSPHDPHFGQLQKRVIIDVTRGGRVDEKLQAGTGL
jgi:predicted DCC family thiol-disulfide oxidoreductase YuxK